MALQLAELFALLEKTQWGIPSGYWSASDEAYVFIYDATDVLGEYKTFLR